MMEVNTARPGEPVLPIERPEASLSMQLLTVVLFWPCSYSSDESFLSYAVHSAAGF